MKQLMGLFVGRMFFIDFNSGNSYVECGLSDKMLKGDLVIDISPRGEVIRAKVDFKFSDGEKNWYESWEDLTGKSKRIENTEITRRLYANKIVAQDEKYLVISEATESVRSKKE